MTVLVQWSLIYLICAALNWCIISTLLNEIKEQEIENFKSGRLLFTIGGFLGTAALVFFFFKGVIRGIFNLIEKK